MGLYNSGVTDLSELESRLSGLEQVVSASGLDSVPPEIRNSYNYNGTGPISSKSFNIQSEIGDTIIVFCYSYVDNSNYYSNRLTSVSSGFTNVITFGNNQKTQLSYSTYIKYSTQTSETISLTLSGEGSTNALRMTYTDFAVVVLKGHYEIERILDYSYDSTSGVYSYLKPKAGYYFIQGINLSGPSDLLSVSDYTYFDRDSREDTITSSRRSQAVCVYITGNFSSSQSSSSSDFELPVCSVLATTSTSSSQVTALGVSYGTWKKQVLRLHTLLVIGYTMYGLEDIKNINLIRVYIIFSR